MSALVTIGIEGRLTALHVCLEDGPHPHTWSVLAEFAVPPRTDARCYRASVDALLASWEGRQLPIGADWSEDIARMVYTLNNCVRVHVWRPDERIHVWWPS